MINCQQVITSFINKKHPVQNIFFISLKKILMQIPPYDFKQDDYNKKKKIRIKVFPISGLKCDNNSNFVVIIIKKLISAEHNFISL